MADFNLEHLKQFRFKQLFNELGWELPAQQQPYTVAVGEETFELDVVAHKRGVQILHCRPDAAGHVPAYATRQKIERKITAEAREHLIVFTDAAQTTQIWQWVSRTPGRPNQYREVAWRTGDAAELLRQKLSAIAFTLDDEESLTVLGVTQRLTAGFDRDKVTKKFYGEFEKQRKAFAEFIAGIPDTGEDLRWYTAVLIDRLMFLWFLQEKRFLDGNKTYLQERLAAHLATPKTSSFYRRFLAPLFFRGFAEERTEANRAAIHAEFGEVPYLNGGLFAQHELEQRYGEALDVADAAFEKLFAFFGQWDWHLDDRPLASGREVNPDVLGYIFEKFVNQKQMGAYYTKEDITEYIGKNTIIPCLLAKVRAEHPGAFDQLAWPLLQQSGDTYLYPAMLKGVDAPYPADIAAGLDVAGPDLLERRKPWNKRADDAVSLPTEIWRETIARHQRTREIRAKIAAGELGDISDLITYNLNIRQFAQDLIEHCTDVALLKSFWFTLAGRLPRKSNEKFRHGLSVLDPTCGSGAFLFAALNILKPLYDATLRTLHAVRSDALIAGGKTHPEKWAEVDEILGRFAAEKSDRAQDYAVIKHIIVHNLYGVDIEEQATEIAKLRLFLKLIALLEPGDDIEPLPDIDFNIRHGNTLVGYATADETERAVKGATQGNLFDDAWEDIRLRLVAVEQQYDNFQIQQVQRGGHVSAQDKQALTDTLQDLEEMLNYHLANEYGVDPAKTKKYEAWKASHKPFHWYVDFYPLMAASGFDVVIGNPPFVEYAKIRSEYVLNGYQTISCGNLHAFVVERSIELLKNAGGMGLVLPISALSTERMAPLQEHLKTHVNMLWHSTYGIRPQKLFEGAEQRVCLMLASGKKSPDFRCFSAKHRRWSAEERLTLFNSLSYLNTSQVLQEWRFPKIANEIELSLIEKLPASTLANLYMANGQGTVYWHRIPAYFVKAFDFVPYFHSDRDGEKKSEDYKPFRCNKSDIADVVGVLNSNLFYWYWFTICEGYHCGKQEVHDFPVPNNRPSVELAGLSKILLHSLKTNSIRRLRVQKTTQVEYDEFYPSKSKELVDELDKCLAGAYKLQPAEVDFLINYDIKYRMGLNGEVDDADD
jgi:hypothetical protein